MVSTFEKPPKGAWRMVALGSLAQNIAIGLSIGSFGVLVLAIEQQFHASRAVASMGASIVVAVMGLLAPVVTVLIGRWSIRTTMMTGVILGSIGYVALALAPNLWFFLAAYGLFVGVGALLAGSFPASILVSNWFPGGSGRALGVMMIPLGAMLVPLVCAPVLEAVGLRQLYMLMGAATLLMLPILLLVKDRPALLSDPADGPLEAQPHRAATVPLRGAEILSAPHFWLLIFGVGLLDGSGMIQVSQLVAIAAEQGLSLRESTLLLSVSGGAGAIGSLLFGWLADRVGGAGALLINGIVQAVAWGAFLLHPAMGFLVVDVILMGLASAGVYSASVAALSHQFGSHNLLRTLGLAGMFGIIPTFLSPPVAGLLREYSGSYDLVLDSVIAACLVAATAMALVMMRPLTRHHAAST